MTGATNREEPPRAGRWRGWFVAGLFAAALFGAVAHWGQVENFLLLLRRAEPYWLGAAVLLQLSTYASVASGWSAVLRRARTPRPLRRLVRVALVKLFADQTVPSAGMGGNFLLIDQLRGLGVPKGAAVAALLLSMIGFYAAYALLAALTLVLLWVNDRATPLMAGVVTMFLLVAFAIPVLALWLRRRGSQPLPPRIEKVAFIQALLQTVAQAPSDLLGDRRLLLRVTMFNALLFLADATTFYACLRALGEQAALSTALIAYIMASIAVTLAPIPMGLGSFEATATATLHLLGVPVEAAFAGTMLFRLLTLWLPLLPGLLLVGGAMERGRRA